MKVRGIARETLEFILALSKEAHPREFAGLLSVEKGVIANVFILPGTLSSETSAVMNIFHMPMDLRSVGSVHSHPGPSAEPSEEDLFFFSKRGDYHIIVCYPYDWNSWECYNREGKKRKLEVIDIEFDEETW